MSGGDLMREAIVWEEGVLYAAWGSGLRVYEAPGTSPPRPVGGALLPIQAEEAVLRATDHRDPDRLRPIWHQWVPDAVGGFVLGPQTLVAGGPGINGGLQAFDLGQRGLPESGVGLHMQSAGTWPAGSFYVAAQDYNSHHVDLWTLGGGVSPPVVARAWSFDPGSDEITQLSATNRVPRRLTSCRAGRCPKPWPVPSVDAPPGAR